MRVTQYLLDELSRLKALHSKALEILEGTEEASARAYLLFPIMDSPPKELMQHAAGLLKSRPPSNDPFLAKQWRTRHAHLYFKCIRQLRRTLKQRSREAVAIALAVDDAAGINKLSAGRIRVAVIFASLWMSGIRYRFFGPSQKLDVRVSRAAALVVLVN